MSGNPIAWLHEPTGNVFKDGECQALIKVWQKQFAVSIPAEEIAADFVPLGRADASSQAEIERLSAALDAAIEWITSAPHDEHCFINDPNPDACRCICGKDPLLDSLSEAALSGSKE